MCFLFLPFSSSCILVFLHLRTDCSSKSVRQMQLFSARVTVICAWTSTYNPKQHIDPCHNYWHYESDILNIIHVGMSTHLIIHVHQGIWLAFHIRHQMLSGINSNMCILQHHDSILYAFSWSEYLLYTQAY